MKKITFLFSVLMFYSTSLFSQTTFEVGAGKTYSTINAAWTAAKTDASTDIIISVGEGTFAESEMTAIANKKIKIIGAGADKTFVKKTMATPVSTFDVTGTTGNTINPGRMFQLNAATCAGLDLTLENITFQLIGFTNTNGGGVVNANQAGQKITVRNCNFNNIMARTGAILQAGGGTVAAPLSPDIQVSVENCFVENCGSIDNSGQDGIIKITSGTFTMNNCSFVNNKSDVLNRSTTAGTTTTGTDRNIRCGVLIGLSGNMTSASISNCNFVNNSVNGDVTFVHPMIGIKPVVTTGTVAPAITLDVNPSITITNVISVGNGRSSSLDGDLFYDGLMNTPSFVNSVFNVAKKFDANTTPVTDLDLTGISGMTVNTTATASNYFEMEADAPKIAISSLGVKSLVRKATSVKCIYNKNNVVVNSYNDKVLVTADQNDLIEIYNTSGVQLAKVFTNKAEFKLSSGVYFIKTSHYSTKVLVR